MGERMRIAVTGAGGLIGRPLVATLVGAGHDVVRLVRRPPQVAGEIAWDPAAGTIDATGLVGIDAAVHLAGAGIGDKRWTDSYKQEILDSRVKGTDLLASTLAGLDPKPAVMVSASAIGWYGDRGDGRQFGAAQADRHGGEQKTEEHAAAIAKEDGGGVEVVSQEGETGSDQTNQYKGIRGHVADQERAGQSEGGNQGQPGGESVHAVDQVEGVDDDDKPGHGQEQIDRGGKVLAQNRADAHIKMKRQQGNHHRRVHAIRIF